jgi:hypothetical protein
MADEDTPKGTLAVALSWLKNERRRTNELKARIEDHPDGNWTPLVAQTNRELAATTIAAAEVVADSTHRFAERAADSLNALGGRIDALSKSTTASTDKLVTVTWCLVAATVFLGLAAILAAGVQAYATMKSPPQTIMMSKP